jgi:hypothetical protein
LGDQGLNAESPGFLPGLFCFLYFDYNRWRSINWHVDVICFQSVKRGQGLTGFCGKGHLALGRITGKEKGNGEMREPVRLRPAGFFVESLTVMP